jgi:hypothetical protein
VASPPARAVGCWCEGDISSIDKEPGIRGKCFLSLRYGLRFHTTSTTSAPIAGVRLAHII